MEHLAEREDRHRDGHQRDAVEQLRRAHREALGAGHRIDPDDGDAQSQHQGGQAAQHRVGDHRGGGHEREEREREVLRGAESRGELRQHGGEEHDAHRGHHAADEGAERRRRQGLGRPAVLGHAVALERGGDGRGLAGGVHEDGHGGVAEEAAEVHAGEHDERGGGLEGEGHGQQQGHGHRGAQSGHHADRGAQQTAQHHPEQVHRGEGSGEALHEESEGLHVRSHLPGCPRAGSGPGPPRSRGRPTRRRTGRRGCRTRGAGRRTRA